MKWVHSVVHLPRGWEIAWVTLSGIAICAAFLRAIGPAVAQRPSLTDVAERLDSASRNHNRIATAIDLARRPVLTPLEAAAVRDGARELAQARSFTPLLPACVVRVRRDGALLTAAGVLCAAAFTVAPRPLPVSTVAVASPSQGAAVIDRPLSEDGPKPVEPLIVPPSVTIDGSARVPVSMPGGGPMQSASATHAAIAGTASASAALPAATAAASAVPGQTSSPPGAPDGNDATAKSPNGARSQPLPRAQEQPPMEAGGGGAEHGSPPGGAGESKSRAAASKSGDGKPSGDPNGGAASGGSPETPPPPDAESGSGGGETGVEQPDAKGAGFSMMQATASDSPPSGEDGRTVGQSPAKKSRGVAPLLLATRQPDLFQGRPLAGPDERTQLQLPPKRNPGRPADAAAAARRTDDERPISPYRVPADLRDAVGLYFQKFHADPGADVAAAGSAADSGRRAAR